MQLPSSWPPARVGWGVRAMGLDTTSLVTVARAAKSRRLNFMRGHLTFPGSAPENFGSTLSLCVGFGRPCAASGARALGRSGDTLGTPLEGHEGL